MCFSASASFGAAITLGVIGAVSLRKTKSRSQIPFACIPLLFAAQQLTEGFVWLSFSNPYFAAFQQPGIVLFLFFAQIIWPFWVPFSIFKMETGERRKKMELVLLIMGALVSLYLGWCLVTNPVGANIDGHHISYEQSYTDGLNKLLLLPYFIAILAPPFFSRVKWMWMLGVMVVLSYVFTALFFIEYTVSVWCFFASLMSVNVLIILVRSKRM